MLSSNSSSCNPFSENDITSFTSTFEDPNFFFVFPNSPHTHFQDYYQDNQSPGIDLTHVYLNSQPHYATAAAAPAVPVAGNPTTNRVQSAARAGKKDRHSKINTARGLRDRRMRLSLDIARRFFDLQDLLGFDKASRTVEWLLRSSSAAIRALARGMPGRCGEYCTSDDYCGEGEGEGEDEGSSATAAAGGKTRRGKRVKRGVQQKRATVARESRRMARERARERTSQKRRLMRESDTGCVSMYGVGVQVLEDFSSDETRATTQWDSFHLNQTHTAPFFPQDEQIEEFEFDGKPWEAYNSFNMSG